MTSTELERLVVRIVMDATGLDVGLGHAERILLRTVNSVARLGQRMTMAITVPLVGMGALAVREFANFDQAMQKTAAVAGDVSKELRSEMEANAIAISNRGIMSATDLASTYYHLVSAGLEARDAMHALGISERFAVAGTMDLEKATLLLINAQTVLGLRRGGDPAGNAEEMKHVSDVIMKASVMTQATPEDFSRALVTKSGAAARVLNKTIEETTAVLSVMASQGTKAELAGEHLYIVWRDTQAAFLKHRDAWDRMGVSVYDTTGRMRNTADIIRQLSTLTGSMSDEQRKLTLQLLGFTDRSVAATFNLLGLGDAIADYEQKLHEANNTTNQIAGDMEKSFLNQVINLRRQIENLAIDIGQRLVPYIEVLMNQVRQGIAWWNALNTSTKDWGVWLAMVAAAAGPVVLVLGTIVGAIGSLVVLIAGLVGGPIGLAILGIGAAMAVWAVEAALVSAAVTGILFLFFGTEGFISAWNFVSKAAKDFFVGTIGFFANFERNVKTLLNWWYYNWDAVLSDTGVMMVVLTKNMIGNVMVFARTSVRLFTAFGGWITSMLRRVFTVEFAGFVFNGLANAIGAFYRFAKTAEHILISIFTGGNPEQAIMAFMDSIAISFAQGATKVNFFETAGDIIKEELGNLRFTEGVISEIEQRGGPRLLYDFGKKAGNAYAEGLASTAPAVGRAVAMATGPISENTAQVTAMLDSLDKESLREERNVEQLTTKLKEQAATYGMNTAQINAWRIAQLGADAETIATANATAEYVTHLKAQEKALKAAEVIQQKANRAVEIEAKHAGKYASPLEEFNRTISEMRGYLAKGLISIHAFYHEFREAQEKLGKGVDIEFRARGMDAVLFNSEEFDKILAEHKNRLEQDAYTQAATAAAMRMPVAPEAMPSMAAVAAAHRGAALPAGLIEEVAGGSSWDTASFGRAPEWAGALPEKEKELTIADVPGFAEGAPLEEVLKRFDELLRAQRDGKRPVVIEGADITVGD